MEDDVDVWRYAIVELHARNDDDITQLRATLQSLYAYAQLL